MKKNSGIIEILGIIIVFVLIAFYFGKDPVTLWENIKPLFESMLDLFFKTIGFLIKIIAQAWDSARP